jgi:hypothetical protein
MKRGVFWIILGIAAFLIIYVFLVFFLRFFIAAEPRMMFSELDMFCANAGGDLCEDQKEFCEIETLDLSAVLNTTARSRCCPVACKAFTEYEFASKRHCTRNLLTWIFNYCYCEPNKQKNKVAIITLKNGIYDNDTIDSQILAYYEAVKKDLKIGNAGLKKVEGTKMSDLDKFIDNLYLNDNVGYVILVGDDLPVADVTNVSYENFHDMYRKLECVKQDCTLHACSDVAVSYILPPFTYSNQEKSDFILNVLKTYTQYHDNFAEISKKYKKSVLNLMDHLGYSEEGHMGLADPKERLGYNLPQVVIFNTDYQKVADEFKRKYIVSKMLIHGDPTTGRDMSISIIGNQTLSQFGPEFLSGEHTVPYYTNVDEFLEFTKENGAPALFVEIFSCGDMLIKSPKNDPRYCCWPQAFIDSGTWLYYSFGGSSEELIKIRKSISNEKTVGMAVRKTIMQQDFFIGDILAHIK